MIIAIDGPAASGKGTIARRLAEKFGFHYLDTGLLYRAVAWRTMEWGFRPADRWAATALARGLPPDILANPRLRDAGTGNAASVSAAIPEVRSALLACQRDFARRLPGAVLDGRDIGTVVCPEAEIKLFVTASLPARAWRRFAELQARGEPVTYDRVYEDLALRDKCDSQRSVAPLAQADGADLLDTSCLDIEAAFDAAVRLIMRKIGQ